MKNILRNLIKIVPILLLFIFSCSTAQSPVLEKYKKSHSKLGSELLKISDQENDHLIINNDMVLIRAFAINNDAKRLKSEIKNKLQTKDIKIRSNKYITGWVKINEISKLSQLTNLKHIVAQLAPIQNSSEYRKNTYSKKKVSSFIGSVTTQGDEAMLTDDIRANFNVNGAGVKIGILSNSYDNLNGAAQGVSDGDLPGIGNPNGFTTPISILLEGPSDRNDEGRAMAEIIHDVAPGAEIIFRSVFFGQEDYVDGINEMINQGVDIIVDDINYPLEPFFQDGIINQAIDEATAQGITYFTAALNLGFNSYEEPFVDSGVDIGGPWGRIHDFGTQGNGDTVDIMANGVPFTISALRISAPVGNRMRVSLGWDDPSIPLANPNGPAPDSDLVIMFIGVDDNRVTRPLAWTTADNLETGIPIDIINYTAANSNIYIAISVAEGPNPDRVKFISLNRNFSFSPFKGTIVGHANSEGAITIGAVRFDNTPEFGGVLTPENFSSAGGVPILLDRNGNTLSAPILREKPDLMAPENGNTSFFGNDIPQDTDSFPNFEGTSAAAPHAAAAAVLMREAVDAPISKSEYLDAFIDTAIDMNDPGYDIGTGYGFIEANAATENLINVLSIEDENLEEGFGVYPNPNNGLFFIETSKKLINAEALVYNNLGQLIYSAPLESNTINLSKFQSGIYYLNIKTEKQLITKKIVIK